MSFDRKLRGKWEHKTWCLIIGKVGYVNPLCFRP